MSLEKALPVTLRLNNWQEHGGKERSMFTYIHNINNAIINILTLFDSGIDIILYSII